MLQESEDSQEKDSATQVGHQLIPVIVWGRPYGVLSLGDIV